MNNIPRTIVLATASLAISFSGCDSGPAKPKIEREGGSMWPALPTNGFISGRTANQKDLTNGEAVFYLNGSQPMNIEVPQYAYHVEEGTGKRSAGIIIQAERTPDGKELLAMQPLEGDSQLVGLRHEYELLGTTPPNDD